MINLEEAIDFETYYELGTISEKILQDEINITINLNNKTKDALKILNSKVKILLFAENYCPDCRIMVPFLEKIQMQNSNIAVYIFKRQGNEELLKEITGETSIPTALIYDDNMKLKGKYVEMPKKIKGTLLAVPKYRMGKYNDEIEEELLNMVIKN